MVSSRWAGLVAGLLVFVLPAGVATARPGDLDLSFGSGTGGSRIDFGGVDTGNAVALAPDGKIIVAGTLTSPVGAQDMLVLRLDNPDGKLDASFGSGTGGSRIDLGASETGNAVALQPDGKIVVAGTTNTDFGGDAFVARLSSPEGTLDPSYGGGFGWSRVNFGFTASGSALALQPDGKIVLAGTTLNATHTNDVLVARLNNPQGTFDFSYGLGTGGSRVDLGGHEFGNAVALQPDGKIVVAGTSLDVTTAASQDDFLAVRLLNPEGTLDSSFNGTGHATVDFGNSDDANAIALQPDGKIVLAGTTSTGVEKNDFAVARLLSNGVPDSSFGTGGKATVNFGGAGDAQAKAMVLQPDGRIIVVGTTDTGLRRDIAVARLLPDGTLDPSFGTGGKSIISLGGDDEFGNAVALQPDGKIIIAGQAESSTASDVLVVRLQGASAPSLTQLESSPDKFRAAARGSGADGTRVSYRLAAAANVRFDVTMSVAGRRKSKTSPCVAPNRSTGSWARCTRVLRLGSFNLTGKAGVNSFHFTGRLNGHKLIPGSYTLLATPSAAGTTGKRVSLRFQITG